MPGIGYADRYVIARDGNVVRVDFARRRDPPAPLFPGAGALRPATRAAMDQSEPQARSAPFPRLRGRRGTGWLECSVLPAPLLSLPRKRGRGRGGTT